MDIQLNQSVGICCILLCDYILTMVEYFAVYGIFRRTKRKVPLCSNGFPFVVGFFNIPQLFSFMVPYINRAALNGNSQSENGKCFRRQMSLS